MTEGLLATGIGSMPGDDVGAVTRTVLGTVPLAYVPELPDRGVHAQMVGRTLAMIEELGVDLQPAGWRVTDAPGLDHRRARSLLAHDLDVFEEGAADELRDGTVKVQVTGPWTLAALVERPRGDKVLADVGLRRDLAQGLADGVARHVDDVRRRTGAASVVLQVDEPMLPAVLGARVPTASGFHKHRAVSQAEAAQALTWVVEAAEVSRVVHCCAGEVPYSTLREVPLDGVSVDLSYVDAAATDSLGTWIDQGRALWAGVVPSTDVSGVSDKQLVDRLRRLFDRIGLDPTPHPAPTDDPDSSGATGLRHAITPTCGLAGASLVAAGRALELATRLTTHLP